MGRPRGRDPPSSVIVSTSAPMTEPDYWSHLEYRICGELAGMSEKGLHKYWCDGISPEAYFLGESKPRILGHVWIVQGDVPEEWKFELLLPRQFSSREEIDWQSLFPPENVTRWLAVEPSKKLIQWSHPWRFPILPDGLVRH
jgi:hypothetical protein